MPLKIAGVEWDKGNLAKCQKHGLTVRDIEYVLLHGNDFIIRDARHSEAEGRYIAIGRTETERSASVAFTLRCGHDGKLRIRPISSRYMHQREIKKYGQKISEI
jgi:uncharacterized protein